jgi:hypothetical protein
MLELKVTSDSSTPELHVASRFIEDLIKLRTGDVMASDGAISKETLSDAIKVATKSAIKDLENDFINGTSNLQPVGIFNATELAEAEQLGKSAASTVDASQSTIAPVDMPDNTLIPDPTTVFGQVAQTTANVANPVAPTTDNPALDANGLPWDRRIHSSNHEMSKDGTWRKRRGVDEATVAAVVAELKGVMSVPVPEPVAMVEVKLPDMGAIQPMTFAELLDGVTQAMVGGTVTQATISWALQSLGLSALPQLVARPDLIPAFREALGGVV